MENQNNNPKTQDEDTQLQVVFRAFYEKPRTMKEVFNRTGILREFICWYCRQLRNTGRLYFIKKRKCSITGEWVKEFTTNEKFVPECTKQYKLF
jgi:hypothetical protein